MRRILLSALFIVVSFSLFAAGPIALDAKRDSLALSLGLGAELLVKYSDPGFDSWDGSTLDRGDINALDRFFAHGYREIPDNISNATALLSMAMPLVNLKDSRDEWKTLTVMFSETLVYTNLTCDSIKRLVGRDRPYMYYSTKSKTGDDHCTRHAPSQVRPLQPIHTQNTIRIRSTGSMLQQPHMRLLL